MDWIPHQGQQTLALTTNPDEILYGGARGGGKTDAGMAWLVGWDEKGRNLTKNRLYRALVIRRNADDLSDWVLRAKVMYAGLGAHFAYRPSVITFPSGATIKTGHLKDADAYTKYQGHEYQRMLIEELTQIPDEDRYLKLKGSCRSTIAEIPPQLFATTNPDGVGHGWVKRRFIDPSPPNTTFADEEGLTRIFIPAKLEDNPTLMESDPRYLKYLESIKKKNPNLYRAWRHGDWDTFVGQYFAEFNRDVHVVRQFTPDYSNEELMFVGGLDWGRANPFAFLGTVVIEQTFEGNLFYRAVTFREVYGIDKRPSEWAKEIKRVVSIPHFRWTRADPSIFKQTEDGSMSIARQFGKAGVTLKPADNNRISGWEAMHRWLSIAPDGLPYWMITEDCVNLIRTLPELIHDDVKVEDVAAGGEDHAPDAGRYCMIHLKWIDPVVGGIKTRDTRPMKKVRRMIDPTKPISLDKFGTAKEDRRDWRAI